MTDPAGQGAPARADPNAWARHIRLALGLQLTAFFLAVVVALVATIVAL